MGNFIEVLRVCQTINNHQSVCFTRIGEDCGGSLVGGEFFPIKECE